LLGKNKKIPLCRNSFERKSTNMPPIDEDNINQRYDSTKGVINNAEVYMVHANKKAYPEYLITFR
jgi:hypothetical protein